MLPPTLLPEGVPHSQETAPPSILTANTLIDKPVSYQRGTPVAAYACVSCNHCPYISCTFLPTANLIFQTQDPKRISNPRSHIPNPKPARRAGGTKKVDVRLPGTGNSNSNGAKPVHLIVTTIKWIQTSRLSIKNFLQADGRVCPPPTTLAGVYRTPLYRTPSGGEVSTKHA